MTGSEPGEAECGRAAELLSGCSGAVALTGAGMSQESGVPTFRDALTGWWARYDPMELATEDAFGRHPARVFGWYLWRYQLVSRAEPNAGHTALARLEDGLDLLDLRVFLAQRPAAEGGALFSPAWHWSPLGNCLIA